MPTVGFPYSFVFHGLAVVALGLLRYTPMKVTPQANLIPDIHLIDSVTLPPLLRAGAEGARGSARKSLRENTFHPLSNRQNQTYYGAQHIVSTPPDPDNAVQTILQPDLLSARKIAAPLPLPNMVKIAMAKAPELPPVPMAVKTQMVVPKGSVAPHEVVENEVIASAPTPVTPAVPERDAPKLAVPTHAVESPKVVQGKPDPVAPAEAKVLAPAPTPTVKPAVQPSVAEAAPAVQKSAQTVNGEGTAEHNLLVINALSLPQAAMPKELPKGELHGAFEVVPALGPQKVLPTAGPSSAQASDKGSGSAADESKAAGGIEKAQGKNSGMPGAGKTDAMAARGGAGLNAAAGHGLGRQGNSAGNGASTGNQQGPFPNITVEGAKPAESAVAGVGQSKQVHHEGYGMTIISSGSSGGGLRDYGVFHNQPTYTIFMDVSSLGIRGTRWSLQYGIASTVRTAYHNGSVSPPYAVEQVLPIFPGQLVADNVGKMIVVQAELNVEGALESIRILQSPDGKMSALMQECLRKWKFQAAEMGGEAVPVTVLMGIPVAMVMGRTAPTP